MNVLKPQQNTNLPDEMTQQSVDAADNQQTGRRLLVVGSVVFREVKLQTKSEC